MVPSRAHLLQRKTQDYPDRVAVPSEESKLNAAAAVFLDESLHPLLRLQSLRPPRPHRVAKLQAGLGPAPATDKRLRPYCRPVAGPLCHSAAQGGPKGAAADAARAAVPTPPVDFCSRRTFSLKVSIDSTGCSEGMVPGMKALGASGGSGGGHNPIGILA
eukprot:CAMPEP_0180596584 /NCGR_PEP_ID=MMETSP1037_2-20121125/21886_1 /TAXON_ID=632150 /ORGANISM="Azadinium spinosum, Strain 3D9" /LENGTH=159 /DNA_ID=CAMNT_0022615089 /DNA_START=27 /DNA_END=504 /DNA_ORIENTATION=-